MLYPDFEEFIASLNAHGVKYLIVGGHAFAFHAKPRATKDLDIFVDRTAANVRKLLKALRDFFGGADLGYTVKDLTNPRLILQLGVAPVRIDLLNRLLGCASFEAAWQNRVTANFGSATAHFLSLDDLMQTKQAAGRPQDLADLAALKRIKARPTPRAETKIAKRPRTPKGQRPKPKSE